MLKTSDQVVTNSATLTDDTALVFALAASSTYEFEGYIVWTEAGNGSADGKFSFTVPTGATIRWVSTNQIDASTTVTGLVAVTASGGTVSTDGGSSTNVLRIRGVLRTSTTTGNLQFQFANLAAGNGRNTTINATSFLKIGKF